MRQARSQAGRSRPRRTAPEEARRLLRAVRALVRRFSVSERADVACCGMTVAQAAALEALREGPLRLGDLGKRLGISPSTLTRNLERLRARGLVERLPDPVDSRSSRAALTARGREAAAEVERQEEAFARAVLEQVPLPARRPLVRTLEALLGAVREATRSCCPGAFEHLMGAACTSCPSKETHHER